MPSSTHLLPAEEAVASEMRAIKKSSEEIIEKLREMAVPVTDETLLHVATISANGDTEIGQLVSDVFMKVGASGVVTVERSNTSKTYFEISEGMRINRGWTSPYFITDQRRGRLCWTAHTYWLQTGRYRASRASSTY